MKRYIAVAALLGCAIGPSFADGEALSAEDLQTFVSGRTIQGSMKSSGNYTEYYAPDGTVKGKDYTGKWRINDNNQLCVSYDSDPAESCWHGRADGNNVTWLRDGREDGMGAAAEGDVGGFRDGDRGRR